MNPIERVFAISEGKEVDRVPVLCFLYDEHPAHQVLGFPKKTDADIFKTWFAQLILKKFGMGLVGKSIAKGIVDKVATLGIDVAITLGFDAVWSNLGLAFSRFPDEHTISAINM